MQDLFEKIEQQLDQLRDRFRTNQKDHVLTTLEMLEESYDLLRSDVERIIRISEIESELFTSPKSLDETLDHIVTIIKREFEFSRFEIILVDHELRRVMRRYSKGGYPPEDIKKLRRYGALGKTKEYCLTNREPWIVNDIKGQDPLWRLSLELDVWVHGTFPLHQDKKDGTSELVGYLHGGRTKKDFLSGKIFSEADIREMKRLGRAIINAIKEAKLAYFEHGVMEIQSVIGSTRMDMAQLPGNHDDRTKTLNQMDQVMDTIIRIINASGGGIFIRENGAVRAVCFRDDDGNPVDPECISLHNMPGTGHISRALFDGHSIIENEVISTGEKMDLEISNPDRKIHTLLTIPLIQTYAEETTVHKNVIGVVVLINRKNAQGELISTELEGSEGGFSTLDRQILESISPHIETIISNTRSHQDLQRLSFTDGLTQLANHTHFMNNLLTLEFKRSQRYGTPLSVILMDIDHFKVFNDIFGHQVGDLVLRETADIIRENTRSVDHVARYGGEEFAVVLHNTPIKDALSYADKILKKIAGGNYIGKIRDQGLFSIEEAARRFRAIVAMEDERIREAKTAIMKKHFNLDINRVLEAMEEGRQDDASEMLFEAFRVTVSMGLAYYPDPRITSQKDLLTSADMLLLKAKENGRNRFESVEVT